MSGRFVIEMYVVYVIGRDHRRVARQADSEDDARTLARALSKNSKVRSASAYRYWPTGHLRLGVFAGGAEVQP